MADMGDMYREWNTDEKAEKDGREKKNLEAIEEWLTYKPAYWDCVSDREGTVLFRIPGKPKVDFYPTANKWRKGKVIWHGNAEKFLKWYEKQ